MYMNIKECPQDCPYLILISHFYQLQFSGWRIFIAMCLCLLHDLMWSADYIFCTL